MATCASTAASPSNVNAPAYELALIPDDVEYTTAAGLLCSALTAYQTINRKPNLNLVRTALVHGGPARSAAWRCSSRRCTASPCSPHARRATSTMCANTCSDAIIDYRTQDVDERVRELTDGRGADLIVDTVRRRGGRA